MPWTLFPQKMAADHVEYPGIPIPVTQLAARAPRRWKVSKLVYRIFSGSSATVSRILSATMSSASSQLIGTHWGSTPTPRSGLVLLSGVVIRSGSLRPSKPESPLAHVRPWLWGLAGSPRILSTTPSSLTWARIPQRFMQIEHEVRTQSSPYAVPERIPRTGSMPPLPSLGLRISAGG